jgi:uncharacterized membrane protein YbhN (UPF0104 family)
MSQTKDGKRKGVFLYLRIAVVVCGIVWGTWWVSQEQRWAELTGIFRQMDWWVFAIALGLFVFSQVLIAFRWWMLLRVQNIFISLFAAVRLHFLGLFYNNFMPGAVGGDFVRAWYTTKHTDRRFEAALSVFFDRAVGLASTFAIAIFFYALFLRGQTLPIASSGHTGPSHSPTQDKPVLIAAVIGVAVVIGLLLLHRRTRACLTKLWALIWALAVRLAARFRDSMALYCTKPLAIVAAFALTVLLQMLTITGFYFLGRNLGISTGAEYYYVVFTLTWVLGAIAMPVSIGGVVIVEVSLVALFVALAGITKEQAGAIALCQRAVWMLASLPGAFIHLSGAHLPKDFSVDCTKARE